MKTTVLKAAVLGFVVGVLAILAMFFFFNVPEGFLARIIRVMLSIVCPPLISGIAEPGWGMAVLPFANSALYALVGWMVARLRAQRIDVGGHVR